MRMNFFRRVHAQHDPYEQYLGGDLQADVAIYFDKASMYDPSINKVPAAMAAPIHTQGGPRLGLPVPNVAEMKLPHREALVGAARILRDAHIPYGVVTNVTLDQLSRYRAVIVPNVLEMTPEQADCFAILSEAEAFSTPAVLLPCKLSVSRRLDSSSRTCWVSVTLAGLEHR